MKKTELLHYDDRFMRSASVGKHGTAPKEIVRLKPRLERAFTKLSKIRESKEQGFFDTPVDSVWLREIEKKAAIVRKKFSHLIVVGIGGSNLGGRFLVDALAGKGMHVTFLENPDPSKIEKVLSKIEYKKTLVNVISKSGRTLEPMTLFMLLRDRFIRKLGKEEHKKHFILNTGSATGDLRKIAKQEGYETLDHPHNVGGRFAVLTNVGLFPAACAGVSVRDLRAGARWMQKQHDKKKWGHATVKFAAHHFLGYKKRDKTIHVVMPYSDRLKYFGLWYRQLWAESLGKNDGDVFSGPTPVASLGTVDQHSQVQLYQDGPADKLFTFVEVEDFGSDISVPNSFKYIEDLTYVRGQKFSKLMHGARFGTAKALKKDGRPNGTITIPEVNEKTVGALIQFY